jgi:hypothetical protein
MPSDNLFFYLDIANDAPDVKNGDSEALVSLLQTLAIEGNGGLVSNHRLSIPLLLPCA